ncbi:sialic acid-binding Ig-like lectin 16 [Neolamprologus brichardi]|uniref:sialic acid-binding Ig-like lectin 16 n=1 Tax=Neolamprologus brichardi TaxID=32507 RepID=UPI00164399F4|nr:sialic acid-binding Ig-like lectin 16 [Neolamprologus brichardi]
MSVLILAALLSSVTCSSADISASAWGQQHCVSGYCVTLNEGEVTVEAGLCVVIPCSYRTGDGFTPKHIAWYKCEVSEPRCGDPIMIFHTNNSIKVQSGFKGRVSFLEPELSQNNCSIFINKLKQSDSGSYHLRVIGELNGKPDGFSFSPRVTVYVKGFKLKPTVMIPTLTEGQQATLTCTAPGLCSGSVPEITWTWRGAGGIESYITGNSTDYKTENLTDVTQSPVSTLTFNPSAKHHNTNVTCKVSFTGETITEETSTLNVNYYRKPQITGRTVVKEGDVLNLTCCIESFPPALIVWNTSNTNLHTGTYTDLHNNTGSATHVIQNVTAEDSGQYICTAKHLDTTLTLYVDVTVTYKRRPLITGNTTVNEGEVLNLTCSVESIPPALIVWKKVSDNTNLRSGIHTHLHNDTGSATLFIPNVTAKDSGQYICAAKHLDTIVTVNVSVTVTWLSNIQNGSGCVLQSQVLTCVCIIEGFPLPTIQWLPLKNNTEYSVITAVSNDTVNSTVSLNVEKHGNITLECVSNNGNEEAKEKFTIHNNSKKYEQPLDLSKGYLKVIIAFLIGTLLTAVVCFLAQKYYRKKQKSSGNLHETLEMDRRQDDPQVYDGSLLEENQTLNLNRGPKEVEYADTNLSL